MDIQLMTAKLSLQSHGINDFNPITGRSNKWICWRTNFSPSICAYCAGQKGKIFDINFPPLIKPPVHEKCRCILEAMITILAGTATIEKMAGADYT